MKLSSIASLLGLALAGCVNHARPLPPDRVERAVAGLTTVSQTVQAMRRADAIRADTAVVFPLRSQAMAFGALAYRATHDAWPSTVDELSSFLTEQFREASPPAEGYEDLYLLEVQGNLQLSFRRVGLPDERYVLAPDGTVSFSLTGFDATERQLDQGRPGFSWGDLVARLLVELPMRMAFERK